jgi:predicted dehydrogenase
MNEPKKSKSEESMNRRGFLKTTSSAVVGGTLLGSLSIEQAALGQISSDTVRVALVGCGGRGTGAANQALKADSNVRLTAMADAFEDKLQGSLATLKKEAPDQVQVEAAQQFVGLDAYQKVIDNVDVVILTTPPGFRPLQFKYAVEAGKHIFLEKPMATDAPGIRQVMESAKLAKQKGLAVVNGFCWRKDYARRAFYKQIHNGALGDIKAIYATYYTGPVKPMPPENERPAHYTDLEWQLRNWFNFVWLCGDSLVEQACHSVDKIAWAMGDVPPLKAVAVGGRQIPAHGGNIFDHFEVNYEYENGVRGFIGCRQQVGCYNENNDYVMGAKGVGTIGRGPVPKIEGQNDWRYDGPRNNMYQTEHDELFASIRKGEPLWEGDWMCTSTLMALMGRMAAYTGQEITWEEALNSQEDLFPHGLSWNSELPVRPMARPGQTEFL